VAKGAKKIVEPPRPIWPEAEIVADPVAAKELDAPRVLVRRRVPDIVGPHGEEVFYLPGPSHISLFTGAGGMDIGLEQAGFCTLVQHEWWDAACETLLLNRPGFFRHAALIQGDIRQTPTSMLLGEAGLRVGECDIVTGGPPCQGFSHANSNRRAEDPRNSLVFEFLRVVREAQPRIFIMENVPGFCELRKGWFVEEFLKTAYAAYYELVYGIVNAVEHGVPQYRNRFFCTGTRRDLWECDGKLAALPPPTHFHQGDLDKMEKLAGRPCLFPDVIIGDAEELELLRQAPGIRYFPDRLVIKPPCPVASGGGGRTKVFLEFYRQLRREEPDRLVFEPVE
jgi:DNA (cytosine-5)-methyltransferase 1